VPTCHLGHAAAYFSTPEILPAAQRVCGQPLVARSGMERGPNADNLRSTYWPPGGSAGFRKTAMGGAVQSGSALATLSQDRYAERGHAR
jgi:hypothetical protein